MGIVRRQAAGIIDSSLASGLALLFLLLLAAVLNWITTVQQRTDAQWVNHTHEVLDALQSFRTNLGEARAELRGHFLTDAPTELQAFRSHVVQVQASLDAFQTLTLDNPEQQAALPRLRKDLAGLTGIWSRSLDIFKQNGREAAISFFFSQVDGRRRLAEIYAQVDAMQAVEHRLLQERAAKSYRAYLVSLWSGIASGVLSTLLVGLYIVALRKHANKAAAAAARLSELTGVLQDADRKKDAFIATLAHELRNPLAPIRNAAEILARDTDLKKTKWASKLLRRQVEHMALLLNDLLDVARITQGKLLLQRHCVSLKTVLDTAVEACMPLINARRHELTLSGIDEDLCIDVDPVRISQVVTNLLNNAARYTEPGGMIHVGISASASDLQIKVRDSGAGIPPDAQQRIFAMFEQVDARSHHSQGGLGIGLSLTKGLVELHGGTISVFSAGAGHGSEFTVTLPGVVKVGQGNESPGSAPPGLAALEAPAAVPQR